MNAFFIPQLGSMIYTMNGMATQLNLNADEPGAFLGVSSHFSGDGFADMQFEVRALPLRPLFHLDRRDPQRRRELDLAKATRILPAEHECRSVRLFGGRAGPS